MQQSLTHRAHTHKRSLVLHPGSFQGTTQVGLVQGRGSRFATFPHWFWLPKLCVPRALGMFVEGHICFEPFPVPYKGTTFLWHWSQLGTKHTTRFPLPRTSACWQVLKMHLLGPKPTKPDQLCARWLTTTLPHPRNPGDVPRALWMSWRTPHPHHSSYSISANLCHLSFIVPLKNNNCKVYFLNCIQPGQN